MLFCIFVNPRACWAANREFPDTLDRLRCEASSCDWILVPAADTCSVLPDAGSGYSSDCQCSLCLHWMADVRDPQLSWASPREVNCWGWPVPWADCERQQRWSLNAEKKGECSWPFRWEFQLYKQGENDAILSSAEKLLNCSLSLSHSHPTFSSFFPLAVVAIREPTITKKWVGPSVPLSQPLKQDPLTRLYLWMLLPWHRSILHMSCWSPGWRTSNLSKLGCENTNAISSCITWTSLKGFGPSAYSSLIFASQEKKLNSFV